MAQIEPVPEPTEGNEYRTYGPPGTGKTTWLAASVKSTVARRMTTNIMVASFTNAAAAEAAGRETGLPRRQIGTLHSFAYRAIGRPPVAEEILTEWNRANPSLALTVKPGATRTIDESVLESWAGATDGDALLGELEILRAKMRPRSLWPTRVAAFEKRYTEWKVDNGVVDFTDMIETALAETEAAPGNPIVGFFDEAQDFTRLELALIRSWGSKMERIILAGDDDQMIYAFKGATVEGLIDPPLPEHQQRVLSQSYRVPIAVHRASQHWVSRLTRRQPKEYLPRDEEGLVRPAPFRYKDPEPLVRDVLKQVDAGRTVMILAACGYMIDPVKHALRGQGVPFHNPYRRTRGDWNPLRASRGTSSADKLLAYLIIDERIFGEASRLWSGGDVQRWSSVLKATGVFRRGAKAAISGLPDRELTFEEVARLFDSEEQLAAAATPDLDWFARNLLAGARPAMEYPVTVVRRRGALALTTPPLVVIGTIHSVKGGQADVVYLFPDLSMRGWAEWAERGDRRDSVIRQIYVAMTRAREELVICTQSSQVTVDPALIMAGVRS